MGINVIINKDEINNSQDYREIYYNKKLLKKFESCKYISVFCKMQMKIIEDDLDLFNITLNNK